MKYKILGNTGLKVSTLCLGTMNYGGKGFFGYMGNLDQNAVDEQIKTVTDAGVNFIDTANIYSEGLSEVMIGQAIKNLSINRDDLVLATKVEVLEVFEFDKSVKIKLNNDIELLISNKVSENVFIKIS